MESELGLFGHFRLFSCRIDVNEKLSSVSWNYKDLSRQKVRHTKPTNRRLGDNHHAAGRHTHRGRDRIFSTVARNCIGRNMDAESSGLFGVCRAGAGRRRPAFAAWPGDSHCCCWLILRLQVGMVAGRNVVHSECPWRCSKSGRWQFAQGLSRRGDCWSLAPLPDQVCTQNLLRN